jgi:hypothetical protein
MFIEQSQYFVPVRIVGDDKFTSKSANLQILFYSFFRRFADLLVNFAVPNDTNRIKILGLLDKIAMTTTCVGSQRGNCLTKRQLPNWLDLARTVLQRNCLTKELSHKTAVTKLARQNL